MRIEGTIKSWNDNRGFGFIDPIYGDTQIFAHISNFPKNTQRPNVGEKISFEISIDQTGKKKAVNIMYLNRPTAMTYKSYSRRIEEEKHSPISLILWVITILASIYFYNQHEEQEASTPMNTSMTNNNTSENSTADSADQEYTSPSFKCDGRKHCTEMTSCAEAQFFSSNCSGTKMDGDMDGIPCEDQWCS